jgi:hypothetical protein
MLFVSARDARGTGITGGGNVFQYNKYIQQEELVARLDAFVKKIGNGEGLEPCFLYVTFYSDGKGRPPA